MTYRHVLDDDDKDNTKAKTVIINLQAVNNMYVCILILYHKFYLDAKTYKSNRARVIIHRNIGVAIVIFSVYYGACVSYVRNIISNVLFK